MESNQDTDYGITGDGTLSAMQLANIVVEKGQSLVELVNEIPSYLHLLKKFCVEDKMAMMTNINILEEIATVEAKINRKGYVLVCSSRTEPQVRVMVVAEIEGLCEGYISRLLDVF